MLQYLPVIIPLRVLHQTFTSDARSLSQHVAVTNTAVNEVME